MEWDDNDDIFQSLSSIGSLGAGRAVSLAAVAAVAAGESVAGPAQNSEWETVAGVAGSPVVGTVSVGGVALVGGAALPQRPCRPTKRPHGAMMSEHAVVETPPFFTCPSLAHHDDTLEPIRLKRRAPSSVSPLSHEPVLLSLSACTTAQGILALPAGALSTAQATPGPPPTDDGDDAEKDLARRMRNREHARRSRNRQKEHLLQLEVRAATLKARNVQLADYLSSSAALRRSIITRVTKYVRDNFLTDTSASVAVQHGKRDRPRHRTST